MTRIIDKFWDKINTPHFKATLFAIVAVLLVCDLVAVPFAPLELILLADSAAIMLAFLVWRPLWGVYAMAALYPFINWQFVFGNLNIPLVDLVALFTFVGLIIKTLIESPEFSWKFIKKFFPGILFFVLFFAAATASLINIETLSTGIKYLFRPLLFFYLMFVVIPWNTVDSKKIFFNIIKIFFGVGLFVAFSGLMSMIFAAGPWYTHRALPFQFGDFNPLGGNHNAVAEILVAMIPFGLLLYFHEPKFRKRNLYAIAIGFFTAILLLTFSRSGWLGLMTELTIIYGVSNLRKMKKKTLIGLALAVVFTLGIVYFLVWNQLDWIAESNRNRLLMTEISLTSFYNHPLLGNGLNTFQNFLGDTFVYIIEFGEPLDSHGFIQKLLVETGLIGLSGFLAFLTYIFYQLLAAYNGAPENERRSALCLIMVFAGLFVMELFSTSYFISIFWLPLGLCLVGAKLISEKKL